MKLTFGIATPGMNFPMLVINQVSYCTKATHGITA
jgi:hypothetical protein